MSKFESPWQKLATPANKKAIEKNKKNGGYVGQKESDMNESMRRTRSMLGNAIQQTESQVSHLTGSTEELSKILGIHDTVSKQTKKGKSLIGDLKLQAKMDKYLFHIVFWIYLFVALFIISRRIGNVFYKFYDWFCYLSSFFIGRIPGFSYVCNYAYIPPPDIYNQFETHSVYNYDNTETQNIKTDL